MSAVVLERPGARRRHADSAAPSLLDDLGGEPTLDEVIAGVWEGLAAHRAAACPVCTAELRPDYGAQALRPTDSGVAQVGEAGCRADRRPEGGRCQDCGSTLS